MKSIKRKVLASFLIVIFSTVIILDIMLTIFIKEYYYDNTETILKNQIQLAASFYNKYFSSTSLEENVYDNVDAFWDQANAQVQIFDINGNLIMDSIGASSNLHIKYPDVDQVLKGEVPIRWVGNVNYYDYKVMAVSEPLIVDDHVIGVIRFITSLQSVDKDIRYLVIFFISISIVVLAIGTIISFFISKGIVLPIKRLTRVAEEMALGNLEVRSEDTREDEIGKLSNTLDYMAEEILKREQLKNEFISSVSHELRTPLTSIKGWVITLNDDKTDKDTLKLGLGIVEKEADRLTAMVEELLDFSRFVNGKIVLKKSEVSINKFIEYLRIYMTPRANREEKTFKVVSNLTDESVLIDGDRMKQVLINLIDNSFKFTRTNGDIEVNISIEEGKLRVIVSDNGDGISDEDLPHVKEKFFKGKSANSSNGIGLSICDEIIKLHDGTLNIESKLNEGTIVTIEVPLKERME